MDTQTTQANKIVRTGFGRDPGGMNSRGFYTLQEAYDEESIREIYDNTNGKAEDLPVAIPSPFALLDLPCAAFKNAYKYLRLAMDPPAAPAPGYVIASKEDFKLVSHVLDMAELFVEYPDKLNFIEINQKENIDKLLESKNERHKNLGKTLETFKQIDKKFGFIDGNDFKIYLIEYEGKIIGGTSKETMFFVTRNYEYLKDIKIGKRNLFSNDITNYSYDYTNELFLKDIKNEFNNRSEKFKKWIVGKFLNDKITSIGQYINELNNFLGENKIVFKQNPEKIVITTDENGTKRKVDETEVLERYGYEYILIDLSGQCVKVESIVDVVKKEGIDKENKEKETYLAKLESRINDLYPRVNSEKNVLLSKLKSGNNLENLEKEIIRLEGIKNIFEDYIIKIPFKSSENFKVLKLSDGTYLYPIKKGVRLEKIECSENGNFISIDVNGLKKSYFKDGDPTVEKGTIIEITFALRLFPFIQGAKEYRALLVEEILGKNENFELSFASNKADIFDADYHLKYKNTKTSYLKTSNPDINLTVKYKDNEFNVYIPVNFEDRIPEELKKRGAEKNYSFAIDFGTTNTHIEYFIGKFVINTSDTSFKAFGLEDHTATLLDLNDGKIKKSRLLEPYLWNEFLPKDMSDKYFPFRTLLLKNGNEIGHNVDCLGKYAIPFLYKETETRGEIFSNFKWPDPDSEEAETDILYKHFLREIAFLLHSKVLLGGGDLAETKICYSYPLALTKEKREATKNFWIELYKEFFDEKNVKVNEIAESIAPLQYFLGFDKVKVEKNQPTLCIDIGGGSTDSVVVTRDIEKDTNKIVFHTSFKFAGNDVFGGTLAKATEKHYNTLTEKYYKEYGDTDKTKKDSLYYTDKDGNSLGMYGDKLTKIYTSKDFHTTEKSSEINSYLFSLEDLLEKDGKDSYMKKLRKNKNIRIAFLYFFSVIIYNLAKMLKDSWQIPKGEKIPFVTNVVFSGNGSKILSIIGGEEDLKVIIKSIFEVVYGDGDKKRVMDPQEEKKLKVSFFPDEAKVLTAKGCLISSNDIDMGVKPTGQEKIYEGWVCGKDRAKILDEIKAFNKCFVEILNAKENVSDEESYMQRLFKIPEGQRENVKKILEDLEYDLTHEYNLTRDEKKLIQQSFDPLRCFILRLFKEFIECKIKAE